MRYTRKRIVAGSTSTAHPLRLGTERGKERSKQDTSSHLCNKTKPDVVFVVVVVVVAGLDVTVVELVTLPVTGISLSYPRPVKAGRQEWDAAILERERIDVVNELCRAVFEQIEQEIHAAIISSTDIYV